MGSLALYCKTAQTVGFIIFRSPVLSTHPSVAENLNVTIISYTL